MLLPEIFRRNEFLPDEFRPENFFKMASNSIMKTDIKDLGDKIQFSIDMPGYDKKDINLSLEDGYLVLSAQREGSKEEKDEEGNYIRRERYSGSCSRSYFVGDDIVLDDVKAAFENGVLTIDVVKKEPAIEESQPNLIEIQ